MNNYKSTLLNPKARKQESLPEIIGALLACLVLLAFYLAVPLIILAACLKIIGVI